MSARAPRRPKQAAMVSLLCFESSLEDYIAKAVTWIFVLITFWMTALESLRSRLGEELWIWKMTPHICSQLSFINRSQHSRKAFFVSRLHLWHHQPRSCLLIWTCGLFQRLIFTWWRMSPWPISQDLRTWVESLCNLCYNNTSSWSRRRRFLPAPRSAQSTLSKDPQAGSKF